MVNEKVSLKELLDYKEKNPKAKNIEIGNFFSISSAAVGQRFKALEKKENSEDKGAAEKIKQKPSSQRRSTQKKDMKSNNMAKDAWIEIRKTIKQGKFKTWNKFQVLVSIVDKHFDFEENNGSKRKIFKSKDLNYN